MNDFVTAAAAELKRLEEELRQDPRYRRIERLKEVLDEYRKPLPTTLYIQPKAAPTTTPPAAHASRPPPFKRQGLGKAQAIRMSLVDFLRERGTAHRKEMLKHVVDKGLMGREKRPLANLAAYLSEWRDTFEPDGRGNFKLRGAAASRERELPLSQSH